jgi:predicted  nucleic acid-binding Zn-ribbon protein
VKADPTDQLRLLDLQQLDSTLERLAHRRRTLPEIAEIAQLEKELSGLEDDAVRAETELSDLAREQNRLENDITVVRQRQTRDQQRLDTGAVGAARELASLQSEIESLHRRQTVLEDEELELMQAAEDAQRQFAEATEGVDRVKAALADADDRRGAAERALDDEAVRTRADREALAPVLPADLVTLYERVRAANGGVGAAALVRRRCEGCHLELAGTELAEARTAPPDEVLRCESCSRVLVRTAESGL